jgi:hypothetical protein
MDLRLLARVPKPMSAEAIYEEFQGRITHEDAAQLHAKAQKTYATIQSLCEANADTISFLSTNITYSDQYSQLFSSLLDPTLSDAAQRLKSAGKAEIGKLKAIASSAKTTFETELLDGRDMSAFFAQATAVLSRLKDSSEVREFQASLRVKASSELETAKQEIQKQDFQQQRLVLSQLITALESKAESQKAKFDVVKNALERDNILMAVQENEAQLATAHEALLHLEKLASQKLGVESLTTLEPMQLVSKAEALLPKLTIHAELLKESGEKYLAQFQHTSQGQALMKQAKQLVQSVENPDAFCENVQKAIAEVQLDKIAEWGTTLTRNREKRQEFVDRMKNHCLDFFVSVLPTIKVDTITGVEEGIEYSLSKLDLSNFKVLKERVKVRMGTVADEELFTVRATHLTALLKGFQWTFAQKYFPYAHGGGLADADLDGGVISLGFKAEKRIMNEATGEFKPTLVLNSMEIEIRQELKITVQGSWFSAVYNLLTAAFAALIRDYLSKTMESKLLKHMIKLLTTLNEQMEKYWPLVFQLLDIRVEDLPSASAWRGAKEIDIQPHEIDCKFTDRAAVPFQFTKGVLNRYVVVSRVLDIESSMSSHADLARVPVGAGVLAINGLSCTKLTLEEFTELLATLPLPYTLRFSLIPEDTATNRQQRVIARPETVSVVFKQEGPFGLRLRNRPLAPSGAIVLGFAEPGADGKKTAAELSGKIKPGQLLTRINDVDLRFKSLTEILTVLKETTKRPATLHFVSTPDGIVKLREWPPMIEWEQSDEDSEADARHYVVVSAFIREPSFAQKSHVVDRGDILWKVNDTVMIAPARKNFADIMETLERIADEKQPMRAIFITKDEYVAKVNKTRKSLAARLAFRAAGGRTPPRSPSSRSSSNNNSEAVPPAPPSPVQPETTRKSLAARLAFLAGSRTPPRSPSSRSPSNNNSEAVPPPLPSPAQFETTDGSDDMEFEVQKEVVFPKAPLGILFGNWKDEAAFVRVFISSAGPAERSGIISLGQAVLQIGGQNVPLDATPGSIEQMIADVAADETKGPPYTITLRDLDMEREIMKQS